MVRKKAAAKQENVVDHWKEFLATVDDTTNTEPETIEITIAGRDYIAVPRELFVEVMASDVTRRANVFTTAANVNSESDDALFDTAMADEDREALPAVFVRRLITGESRPLRLWREYREMTQVELGDAAGVRQATISQIERGEIDGKATTLKALADALGCIVDDLLP